MSDGNQNDDKVIGVMPDMLRTYGQRALRPTLVVTGLVLVLGALYLFLGQPVRHTSALEFRPTFAGAAEGMYPNDLAFSPTDVTAGPIVDLVYDNNNIQDYCSHEVFRGGFYVELYSDQSRFLDAEYQPLLTEIRLTAVERQNMQAEYEVKRAALPLQYRLVFVKHRSCAIPTGLTSKILAEVLLTWASEAEAKRGVLSAQSQVLTPAVLDTQEGPRLIRVDLLRIGLERVISNIASVQELPGADLIRLGDGRLNFQEVKDKLIDLSRSRLERLIITAGGGMVSESMEWISHQLRVAVREQETAKGRVAAYQVGLQHYSGFAETAPANRAPASATRLSNGDVRTLSPQIDRTFIDRIVEMSDVNTMFRQALTESMVNAEVEAVSAQERVGYYRDILEGLGRRTEGGLALAEVERRIDDIVENGKALTSQFNDVYDEYSRVSLRVSGAMYQTRKPVTTEALRAFTVQSLAVLVFLTCFAVFVSTFGFYVVRDRMRPDIR